MFVWCIENQNKKFIVFFFISSTNLNKFFSCFKVFFFVSNVLICIFLTFVRISYILREFTVCNTIFKLIFTQISLLLFICIYYYFFIFFLLQNIICNARAIDFNNDIVLSFVAKYYCLAMIL